ncbi:AbiJ-NTD4 domain-containing protein [Bosea vaviloviae]|uniref:Uncharacterized protein n=1 Tax=Bosea vaviloviae TaxID=1526658 RepID=A0A0N1N1R5_9HYPH|nr:hypothetical protein [Bosea vaviloviae]KPH81696.1 hypothetical protein AE618_08195 [Bosea vaviloviae]
MITDIFARRYSNVQIRNQYFEEDRRFMNQAAVMMMDPLWLGQSSDTASERSEEYLKIVHDKMALEVGRDYLSDRFWWQKTKWNGNENTIAHTFNYSNICKNYLIKMPPDLSQGDAWVKERLSLVEIGFQLRWQQIKSANADLPAAIAKAKSNDEFHRLARSLKIPGLQVDGIIAHNARINAAFQELVKDLNERLRLARYKLNFHNGLLQLSDDELIGTFVEKPFWELVNDPRWKNVDIQIKESIDRRDKGDRTAAFHAVSAVESCIKIISDVKGWTKGTEKGAANYVDNLMSKANGRFIDVWEGELLTKMFSDVRNPFAHGPGQAEMPTLTPQQTNWAIETAMIWCKSLIRRM